MEIKPGPLRSVDYFWMWWNLVRHLPLIAFWAVKAFFWGIGATVVIASMIFMGQETFDKLREDCYPKGEQDGNNTKKENLPCMWRDR